MKKKMILYVALLLLMIALAVPAWMMAAGGQCVDCDGPSKCKWDVGEHTVCSVFAGGNGCVSGGGTCDLQ